RAPWDQPRGTERDDLEESSLHRMIILNSGEIVACGRLQLNGPREAQIRYMAVDPAFHGKGYGRAIITELETLAADAGAEKVVLQARANALGFYEACGYQAVRETFLLYNSIQHYLMEKALS
ncbi:MAG: GNAT family N-acetyltransferase, partial [Bacteroidia bacterium]|nr:GNAT family N-acetyltransferase [Bacteroidia bacterium]